VLTAAALGVNLHAAAASSHRCLVATGSGDQPFARNFNPFSTYLDLTMGAIYEPLVIVTAAGGGHQYNWLASAFGWSRDRKTLTLTVRRGVRWSDGSALTSKDVVYTLTAGRQRKVMDQIGLTRRGNEVVSVRAIGADKVAIRLNQVDTTFVESVLANDVVVVPRHVFAGVKHVGNWANAHPVGTGPFTRVESFGTQSYTLARNPDYWRSGAPHVACIQRVSASSEESAVLQMIRGDIDLTNDLVPNAKQAYVAHDPAHYHFFYPASSPATGLFVDDTRYPYSIVALRKAISLAIDRQQLTLAEYRYPRTADGLGMNRVWPGWIDKQLAGASRALAAFNPTKARRLLLEAGFTYDGSTLLDPRHAPVVMEAIVMASWPDWYADWALIRADLGRIGIRVRVNPVPDFGAWLDDALSTKKATLLWNSAGDTTTPYGYFKEHLDASSFVPSGHRADRTGNWEHFKNDEATRLLAKFRATSDSVAQRRLANRLERIWLNTLPFIPLFASPTWSTYSTRYFVGYPTEHDYYVQPDFTAPDYVVAWTRIKPRS
jgi:peptide/nickel transport system substrate-binding protein